MLLLLLLWLIELWLLLLLMFIILLRFNRWICSDVIEWTLNCLWDWWWCWNMAASCSKSKLIGYVWKLNWYTIWIVPCGWSLNRMSTNTTFLLWNSVGRIECIAISTVTIIWFLAKKEIYTIHKNGNFEILSQLLVWCHFFLTQQNSSKKK